MSGPVVVRCRGVARTYGKGRQALVAVHGLDCEIVAGQQIAVIGASGSGKSTLVYLLAGLDAPTVGTVTWPAVGAQDSLRPGAVAVVFQGPSLVEALDVAENVALPLVLAGVGDAAAAAAARRALARLGIEDLAAQLPEELSGGQAQRVSVARALVGRPRLILADEPTGQLDASTAAFVVDTLVASAHDLGAALVVTTHDARMAARLGGQWHMTDGRLDAGEALPCSA